MEEVDKEEMSIKSILSALIFNNEHTILSETQKKCEVKLSVFFDDFVIEHLESTKKDSAGDWSTFNVHMRKQLGNYQLCELNNQIFDAWVKSQKSAGYMNSTINKHIFLLNRILNLAFHWGYLNRGPILKPIAKLPIGDYTQKFLSKLEIDRLLQCAQKSNHPYLYHLSQLLLLTGARVGEARLARWSNVCLDQGIWTVPKSKSGRSRRIVLSDAAITVLKNIAETSVEIGVRVADNCFVFTNPRTGTCYESFYASWHKVRDAAGLPKLRIHDLRHTYASHLINNGVSLYEVQTLLGHSTTQMTQRYAHLAPNRLHEFTEVMSRIVNN